MSSVVDPSSANDAAQAPGIPPPNPFVGPQPLDVGQPLHGRRLETEELSNLIVSKRVVLLFSPSGAGKTSLIRAGLTDKLLHAYHMQALPAIRLGCRDGDRAGEESANPYVLATIAALETMRPKVDRRSSRELCQYSLQEYFEECVVYALDRDSDSRPNHPLLIFDQFEELFVDPLDVERKREFLMELGSLLRGETDNLWESESGAAIWALFAMREDRIAELQPYLNLIPTAFEFRYRLDALSVGTAKEVVLETGKEWISDDAAEEIINDLRMVSVRGVDGKEVFKPGPIVEPVQLQIVCRGLWEKVVKVHNKPIIASDFRLEGHSEINSVLAAFYDEKLADAIAGTSVSERRLREWIDAELISPSGVRTQQLYEPGQFGGDVDIIARLVDAHVLRMDNRAGRDWIELPHDRFVRPVCQANAGWLLAHMQPFQLRAKQWHATEGLARDPLLLLKKEFDEAEAYARLNQNDVSDEEREFLDASRQHNMRLARKRKDHLRIVTICAAVAIAISLGVWFFLDSMRRKELALAVDTRAVYDGVVSAIESKGAVLAKLLLLRDDAIKLDKSERSRGAKARRTVVDDAIRRQLALIPAALSRELRPHQHIVWSLVFTSDGSRLVAGSWDGHISVQSVAEGGAPDFVTQDLQIATYAVAMNDANGLVASTHGDGRVLLWQLSGNTLKSIGVLMPESADKRLPTAGFSDDGRWLAAAGWNKRVYVWDLANPRKPAYVTSFGKSTAPIQSIAFIPGKVDGGHYRLASTDYNGNVQLWSVGEGMPKRPKPLLEFGVPDHGGRRVGISASAASPSGRYFVVGDTDGCLHVWDLTSRGGTIAGAQLVGAAHRGSQQDTHVKGIAFSPDSSEFVSVGLDGYLVRWTIPADVATTTDLAYRTKAQRYRIGERLFSVAYHPSKLGQVAVGGTRSIRLLDLERGPGPALSMPLPARAGQTAWRMASMDVAGTRIAARGVLGEVPGPILLWDRGPQGIRAMSSVNEPNVAAFALSPDGRRLVLVDCRGQPMEWMLQTGSTPTRMGAQSSATRGCVGDYSATTPAFSPDGRFLATADGNRSRLWTRTNDGQAWRSLGTIVHVRVVGDNPAVTNDFISHLAFSPDSRHLATGTKSGGIRLWSMEQSFNRGPVAFADIGQGVSAMSFRPDGKALSAGSDDGFVTEYAVPKLYKPRVTRRHERAITGVAYGSGKWISADADGYLVEWLARPGTPVRVELTPRGSAPINAIALSGDGTFLIVAADDLLAWDLAPAQVLETARRYAERAYVRHEEALLQ